MLTYATLAAASGQRQQSLGRNRLLVLTAASACRAGWLDVAERCRQLVLNDNPRHLIGKSPTVADALRDADFQAYLKQQERLCGYERAEHLLEQLDPRPGASVKEQTPGQQALALLDLSVLP